MESVKRHLYQASSYVCMVGIPLIVGFVVLSDSLRSWFLGDGYTEVPILLMVMSVRFISSGFGEIFGTQLFIAIGKEKYQTIATVIAAIVNITINFFLIPILGAVGAAIATAICEVTVTVMLAIFAYRLHIVSFRKIIFSSWKYILSAAVMFVPIFFMQRWLGNGLWQFFVIVLAGVIVYASMLFIVRDRFFLANFKNVFSSVKRKLHFCKAHDSAVSTETEINTIANIDSDDSTQTQQDINKEKSDVQK